MLLSLLFTRNLEAQIHSVGKFLSRLILKRVCVVVHSRGITKKSPDSGPGNLVRLGCHTCGECTKLHSLITACFCLQEW